MERFGPAFALLTALSWSFAVILFKKAGDRFDPVGLNVFKNVIGLLLFLLTYLVLQEPLSEASTSDILWLLGSGAVGIGLADTFFFRSLNLLGASRAAVVDCAYSPFIVFFAFVLLGETLSPVDAVGAVMIIGAVLLTVSMSDGASSRDLPRQQLLKGALYGVVAMAMMGIAVVAVKPILERQPVLFATTIRMIGGVGVLALWIGVSRSVRASVRKVFKPQSVWRYAIPGSIVGTYVSLLFWIAGFKYNPANVASILNQTSTVFTVLLATLLLRERLTPRRAIAVAAAFGGSILVLL